MKELMSYLPENYRNSPESVAFQNALQPEIDRLWAARDDLLAQLDPFTATWGLDLWEDALGISPGMGLAMDLRRRQIVAKLQGRGPTTPEMLKNVAETVLGVPVRIVEVFSEYRVELVAEPGGTGPVGDKAARLQAQLLDILPAHLDFQVVFQTAVLIPVRVWPGARLGVNTLPERQHPPPPAVRSGAAVLTGWRVSIASLPPRAEKPPWGEYLGGVTHGL